MRIKIFSALQGKISYFRVVNMLMAVIVASINNTDNNTDSFSTVKKQCHELLIDKGFLPEDIQLADAGNLRILNDFESATNLIVFIAAKIGDIRLIDNMLL